MATVSSLRNRLLLFQAEYRDAVIGVVFFCALPLAALIPIAMNQDNPVVATQSVMGTIEYVRLMPINPKMAAGRGLYYTYDVRLDGNNAVTSSMMKWGCRTLSVRSSPSSGNIISAAETPIGFSMSEDACSQVQFCSDGQLSRPSLSTSKAKNASWSMSRITMAFFGRLVTPHQSITVMPMVSSEAVSTLTLQLRPLNRSGFNR